MSSLCGRLTLKAELSRSVSPSAVSRFPFILSPSHSRGRPTKWETALDENKHVLSVFILSINVNKESNNYRGKHWLSASVLPQLLWIYLLQFLSECLGCWKFGKGWFSSKTIVTQSGRRTARLPPQSYFSGTERPGGRGLGRDEAGEKTTGERRFPSRGGKQQTKAAGAAALGRTQAANDQLKGSGRRADDQT